MSALNCELRRLSPEDGRDVYEMLQEIPARENRFSNDAFGLSYEEFKDWLIRWDRKTVEPPEGEVPETIYWLYVDGVPVGIGHVRHRLNDWLRTRGGNIGYGIRPSQRGKGYSKVLLTELKARAAEVGVTRALITIRKDNPASIKAALACGFEITGESEPGPHGDGDVRLYLWGDCP